jgi:hypothetical protein
MITTKKGNLFDHIADDCVIPHCVNNLGKWGSGFVLAIDKYLGSKPKEDYIGWSRNKLIGLGSTKFSTMERNKEIVTVAHMWAQHQTIREGYKPVRYAALIKCMEEVLEYCQLNNKKIIAPHFCSGLAGGNWDFIRELIDEIWGNLDVTIFEY